MVPEDQMVSFEFIENKSLPKKAICCKNSKKFCYKISKLLEISSRKEKTFNNRKKRKKQKKKREQQKKKEDEGKKGKKICGKNPKMVV